MDPLNTSSTQQSNSSQLQSSQQQSAATTQGGTTPPVASAQTAAPKAPGLNPAVNQETCIGCSLCTVLASGTFAMDPMTGKAFVQNPTGDDDDTIKNAEASCPVRAISV